MAVVRQRNSFLGKIVGCLIDGVLAFVLALLLASTVGRWWAGLAADILRIGEPGSVWQGGWAMTLGAAGNVVFGFPFAVLLVQLSRPIAGATPGRALVMSIIKPPQTQPTANTPKTSNPKAR